MIREDEFSNHLLEAVLELNRWAAKELSRRQMILAMLKQELEER